MNRRIIGIVAASVLVITSPATLAFAQATGAPANRPERAVGPSIGTSIGPSVAASTAGIRPSITPTAEPSAQQAAERSLGAGQNVALMVVGGAALVVGAIIGKTAGTLLAVSGAVVGLYGLYNYVR